MRRLVLLALATATCLVMVGCATSPSAQNDSANAPSTSSAARSSPASSHATTAVTPSASAAPARAGSCVGPVYQQYLTSNVLTAIQFVSPTQGWVVGQREILATADGGQHWTTQDSGRLDLVSVDFISSQTGWAVGLDSLLVTHDGGRHWTRLPDPCPVIRSVHFQSAQVGFAIAGGKELMGDGALAPGTGGELLVTKDGGRNWSPSPSPVNPQTVCFVNPGAGWLGAGGNLYRISDGVWRLAAAGPKQDQYTMFVQCAGPGSVWGLDIGAGAASSQQPHVGYHGSPTGADAIFAEQYFPHPGVVVKADSPSAYAGPLSAIDPTTAVFADWCPVCSALGTAEWDVALNSGVTLVRKGSVSGINQPVAASFLTSQQGWIVGVVFEGQKIIPRIVSTSNGGVSWQTQWTG
jgi:photosystem II stability/assembly factor-like uncharacterized protein